MTCVVVRVTCHVSILIRDVSLRFYAAEGIELQQLVEQVFGSLYTMCSRAHPLTCSPCYREGTVCRCAWSSGRLLWRGAARVGHFVLILFRARASECGLTSTVTQRCVVEESGRDKGFRCRSPSPCACFELNCVSHVFLQGRIGRRW